MPKVLFSLSEANAIVKKIKPLVERLEQLNEQLYLLDNTKIEFDDENMENFLLEVELNKNFHEKNVELYSILGSLVKQGCVVRDIERHEYDFYSRFGDKEIILCWDSREETIKNWHYVGETIEQRKPITILQNSYYEQLKKMK